MKINENTQIGNTGKTLANAIEIEDSGSNTNGTYIKFSDGTMICTKKKTFTNVSFNVAWGNMYETAQLDLGNFPATFIENPVVNIMAGGGNACFCERAYYVSTTSAGKSEFCRPTSGNGNFSAYIIAIGKWK